MLFSQAIQIGVLSCCVGVGPKGRDTGQRESNAIAIMCDCINPTELSIRVWYLRWISRGAGGNGYSLIISLLWLRIILLYKSVQIISRNIYTVLLVFC